MQCVENLHNNNYSVRLINSYFRVNFEIRLDWLFKLITHDYGIICNYEPCIYPGAKVEYYHPNGGKCLCTTTFCNGKRNTCKKITISVFQSGCIIITGANCIEHIEVAYEFITAALRSNIDKVYRQRLVSK